MSEPKDCGRCHLAGVPQVMPSGAIFTDDFCGGCPLKAAQSSGELVIDVSRIKTPEEIAVFWQRVEESGCLISVDPGVAQYASATIMMPPRFVGSGPPVVVFDDGDKE
jgi:hypothetical protein